MADYRTYVVRTAMHLDFLDINILVVQMSADFRDHTKRTYCMWPID